MAVKTTKRPNFISFLPIAGIAVLVVLLAVVMVIALLPSDTPEPEPTLETLPPPPATPYGPEDFTVDENGYISCTAGEAVLGIDISGYQENIDWEQVKNAGVEFVIIRVGGRGYGKAGNMYADSKAQEHYRGAKAAGLKVGAYFFSQATSQREAASEAVYMLMLMAGWQLDLPVVYDWEYVDDTARTAHVDAQTLTACTKVFCNIMEKAGYEPMIYFNQHQAANLLELEQLTQYKWWLAMYDTTFTYPYKVDFWQYSCEGKVPGIEGNVDLNLYFPYE